MRILHFMIVLTIAISCSSYQKNERIISSYRGDDPLLISAKTCKELVVDSTIVAFTAQSTNHLLYTAYQISYQSIDQVRHALHDELIKLCENTSELSLLNILGSFHRSCSRHCQRSMKSMKGDNPDSICLSICNRTYDKLKAFEKGLSLNKGF